MDTGRLLQVRTYDGGVDAWHTARISPAAPRISLVISTVRRLLGSAPASFTTRRELPQGTPKVC